MKMLLPIILSLLCQLTSAQQLPSSDTTMSASDALSPAVPVSAMERTGDMKWIDISDPCIEIRGLPWFAENAPDLWRLPKRAQATTPEGAWRQAVVPSGGRIRLSCDTTSLAIRARLVSGRGKPCHFEAYVGNQPAGSVVISGTETLDLVLFEGREQAMKDITIYLPNNHQVRVYAVGITADARFQTPPPFALERPLVCYGSSVLQGTGASRGSMTYPAILARQLNLDFVNLGFGGSGRAEPQVVSLVSEIDACGFLFDLGKSYGTQPIEVYAKMLDMIRESHPEAPIFVVTPIYSQRERTEPEYLDKSEKLRILMRQAAQERIQAEDQRVFVVEGLDICGEADWDAFNDPTHPNDEGNRRIAERLVTLVERVVLSASSEAR